MGYKRLHQSAARHNPGLQLLLWVVDGPGGRFWFQADIINIKLEGFIREGTLFTANVANITFLGPGTRLRVSSPRLSRRETSRTSTGGPFVPGTDLWVLLEQVPNSRLLLKLNITHRGCRRWEVGDTPPHPVSIRNVGLVQKARKLQELLQNFWAGWRASGSEKLGFISMGAER